MSNNTDYKGDGNMEGRLRGSEKEYALFLNICGYQEQFSLSCLLYKQGGNGSYFPMIFEALTFRKKPTDSFFNLCIFE